jgi:hypothetical protein
MTIKPESKPARRGIGQILMIVITLSSLAGIITMGVLYYGQQAANAEPSIPSGVSLTTWLDNGKGGQHVLQIAQGDAPPVGVRVIGTVKTDTDCDPDAQGINHCHNVIALENGRSIEVIHNHVMHRYPCLSPGQRLSITRLNANWVVALEGQQRPVN